MNWTEFLTKEIETAYAATAALLDKVDGDKLDWKPQSGSNWLTVGQLLKHMTQGCGAGCKAFVTGDWGLPDGRKIEDLSPEEMIPPADAFPTVASVEEAKKLIAADGKLALQMVDQAGEDSLCNKQMAAPWMPDQAATLGWQLHQMVQHMEKHKSQLFYYLKLQGKPVRTPDLWG